MVPTVGAATGITAATTVIRRGGWNLARITPSEVTHGYWQSDYPDSSHPFGVVAWKLSASSPSVLVIGPKDAREGTKGTRRVFRSAPPHRYPTRWWTGA